MNAREGGKEARKEERKEETKLSSKEKPSCLTSIAPCFPGLAFPAFLCGPNSYRAVGCSRRNCHDLDPMLWSNVVLGTRSFQEPFNFSSRKVRHQETNRFLNLVGWYPSAHLAVFLLWYLLCGWLHGLE